MTEGNQRSGLRTMPASNYLKALSGMALLVTSSAYGQILSATASAHAEVVRIVTQIQKADYEGNRANLKYLYEQLGPYVDSEELSSRVLYWRGFALWRRALNGFNDSIDPQELEQDLMTARDNFNFAIARAPAFTDAKIGAWSCIGNLIFLNQKDVPRVKELAAQAVVLQKQAQAEAPDNPRLLWVLGATQWHLPAHLGGGQDKAMETYQRGLKFARAQNASVDGLEPSWGEPELLMNLAWANLHATSPDANVAEQYAHFALVLVPYWRYVRDILLPQIHEVAKKRY